jgi:hypothetical protein
LFRRYEKLVMAYEVIRAVLVDWDDSNLGNKLKILSSALAGLNEAQ